MTLELVKSKSEAQNMENFTSTISHEFKTPVGTALSFIDLLLREILVAQQIKYLSMVKTSLNLL